MDRLSDGVDDIDEDEEEDEDDNAGVDEDKMPEEQIMMYARADSPGEGGSKFKNG